MSVDNSALTINTSSTTIEAITKMNQKKREQNLNNTTKVSIKSILEEEPFTYNYRPRVANKQNS